ncbi:MAG: phosphatase [Desulfurococcus sp.]|nr:phosphatase [Desulfurococcus sp.]
MKAIAVALDYDGVLVDSYKGVPVFYTEDLPSLSSVSYDYAKRLLYIEYLAEGLGLLREDIWFKFIPGLTSSMLDELISRYWERRIEYSTSLPGSRHALEKLSSMNISVYHVGYRDDIYGLKEHRIESDGFTRYFREIYVVGENTSSRLHALLEILGGHDVVIYVDDKPLNLAVVEAGLRDELKGRVILVKHNFKPPYSPAWVGPHGEYIEVSNLLDVVRLVKKQAG